jgi:hypothetical protein
VRCLTTLCGTDVLSREASKLKAVISAACCKLTQHIGYYKTHVVPAFLNWTGQQVGLSASAPSVPHASFASDSLALDLLLATPVICAQAANAAINVHPPAVAPAPAART